MKVLLQKLESQEFFTRRGDWTTDADEAFDFREVVVALDFALLQGFDDVRAVLKFVDSQYDFPLPTVHAPA